MRRKGALVLVSSLRRYGGVGGAGGSRRDAGVTKEACAALRAVTLGDDRRKEFSGTDLPLCLWAILCYAVPCCSGWCGNARGSLQFFILSAPTAKNGYYPPLEGHAFSDIVCAPLSTHLNEFLDRSYFIPISKSARKHGTAGLDRVAKTASLYDNSSSLV